MNAATLVVGLLVALAGVVLASAPVRARSVVLSGGVAPGVFAPGARRDGRAASMVEDVPERAAGPSARLEDVVVQAAAGLRAGLAADRAWSVALGRPVRGSPTAADLIAAVRTGAGGRSVVDAAAGVAAAVAVADELGAPLAAVLDRVASALAADDEAAGDVAAAVAGPRSSARVLGWLPVLAVLLGIALGADPLEAATAGPLAAGALAGGAVLAVMGRVWSAALVRRATRAGDDEHTRGARGSRWRAGLPGGSS